MWATASGEPVTANRPQDISVTTGDAVDLVRQYGDGELGPEGAPGIGLEEVDEVLVMGSTGLLYGMQQAMAGDGALVPYFGP
ncbi:MAG: hypothetical protein ABEJ96_03280, partial [Thiohalorhabdaceae bacterium]